MSLLRNFERATSRIWTNEIAQGSLFAFLCPALYDDIPKERRRRRKRRAEEEKTTENTSFRKSVENTFITALARAGSCHTSRSNTTSAPMPQFRTRPRLHAQEYGGQKRHVHTKPRRPARDAAAANSITRDELHELVDIYGKRADESEEQWPISDQDIVPGAGTQFHNEALDHPWDDTYFTANDDVYGNFSTISTTATHTADAHILAEMEYLLKDSRTPHDDLYALYKQLPQNRINNIPEQLRIRLVKHLSRMPRARFQSSYADDFLALVHDIQAEIPNAASISLWTTAIRYVGLAKGVPEAVKLWREIEATHGILANNRTFSVLFDLAVRSQHFALAEMLEKESRLRRIELDRVSRMSRIFYHGVLGDGASVRHAYAALVNAGEIVDTAVLTNVISALIDAGELPAAEETFSRMKTLHAQKRGATSPPNDWQQRRDLRALLTDAAHAYRDRPEDRQKFQDAAPVGPDWRTYRAFIGHHARETGQWDKIEELLLEMKKSRIPLNREIYATLFRGFAKHGGIQLASWNRRNLELVWDQFEKASRRRPEEFAFDGGLCVAIVRAFVYCADKRRAGEVWEVLRGRWRMSAMMQKVVRDLLFRRRVWPGG